MDEEKEKKKRILKLITYTVIIIFIAIVIIVGRIFLRPQIGNVFISLDDSSEPMGCLWHNNCTVCVGKDAVESEYCSECLKKCNWLNYHTVHQTDRQTENTFDLERILLGLVIIGLILVGFGFYYSKKENIPNNKY